MKRILVALIFASLIAACVPVTPQPGETPAPTRRAPQESPTAAPLETAGPLGDVTLSWKSPRCDVARFSLHDIWYGKCGDALAAAALQNGGASLRLEDYQNRFKPFEAITPSGTMTFDGRGDLVASPAEQRALGHWAQLAFDQAVSGRTGAAWGLALAWHREGGIAGFCDDLVIYLDGAVLASTCRSRAPVELPAYHLTATQLERLYAWTDGLQNIEYRYSDPAVADAMSIALNLSGSGPGQATDEDIQAIAQFAAGLFAQVQQSQNPTPELVSARNALLAYFDALETGDYRAAEKVYGGSYEMLTTWNPDTPADDLDDLWRLACTQNGLQCLPVRAVVLAQQIAADEFKFTLEFSAPDGALFRQGPCCGDTGPSIDTFEYSVVDSGEGWKVMDLPPYVP